MTSNLNRLHYFLVRPLCLVQLFILFLLEEKHGRKLLKGKSHKMITFWNYTSFNDFFTFGICVAIVRKVFWIAICYDI
jgi:hypothetical protein